MVISSGVQTTDPVMCTNTITISPPVIITFCDTITDVSKTECEALMYMYDHNGGSSWTEKTGWGTDTEVCSWYGVTCNDG